jgi:O-antigen/teichoic acid export membrane protein
MSGAETKGMTSVFWSLLNSFLYNGLSLLFVVLLGNLLLPDDMGVYVTLIMILTYTVTLMSLQIQSAVIQKLNDSRLYELRTAYFTTGWVLILVISVAVVVLMYVFRGLVHDLFNLPAREGLLVVFLPLIMLRLNREYLNRTLQADLLLKTQAAINVTAMVVQIVVSLVLLAHGYSLYGIVIGIYLADVLAVIWMSYVCIKRHGLDFSGISSVVASDMLRFSLLIYVGTIAVFLDKNIDLFIVNHYLAKSELAIYNYASIAALLTLVFGNSVSVVTFPKLTRAFSRSLHEEVKNIYAMSLNFSFFVLSVCSLVLAFHAEALIGLVLPPVYMRIIPPLCVLLVGLSLFSSFASIGSIFTARGIPAYAAFAAWGSLFLNIVLCIVLIPRYGITGSAMATCTSFLVRTLVGMALVQYKIKTDYRHVCLFFSFVLMVAAMAAGRLVFDSIMARELLLLLYAIAVFFLLIGKRERKLLRGIYQSIAPGPLRAV